MSDVVGVRAVSVGVRAASSAEALAHFAARLAFETDVSDVAADLAAGFPGIVVVDSRSVESWNQGHVQGAVHLPTAQIAIPGRVESLIPRDATVVVYCWGPACNGATKAALEFAKLGYAVKEMIGGFEYYAREGFPVEDGRGVVTRRSPDPLTAPVSGISCAC
ncbi:rhodanese-like domain-containing protein [Actinomadura hibisca]|uniref:rhodanese-like domain-containing protein n=1 Tax=Actinomadura hibisca TaxID=68565 RepID=UPI00082CBDB4|nr:rhodanese-like domain-containing protein [Actinomadura hibisca]